MHVHYLSLNPFRSPVMSPLPLSTFLLLRTNRHTSGWIRHVASRRLLAFSGMKPGSIRCAKKSIPTLPPHTKRARAETRRGEGQKCAGLPVLMQGSGAVRSVPLSSCGQCWCSCQGVPFNAPPCSQRKNLLRHLGGSVMLPRFL